jgi:putative hydrolase of the HAD superfamily
MKQPRALLLDLDNTAYDYQPCHEAGLLAAGAEAAAIDPAWSTMAGFEVAFGAARSAVKRTTGRCAAGHSRLLYFKRMLETRHGETRAAPALRLDEAYWRGYLGAMQLDAGCRELLAEQTARGVRIAWVTNFTTRRQLDKLARLGLDAVGALLVTSEEAGAEKPDPRGVALALERLGVAAGDAWMVGDDPIEDVQAALAGGVTMVLKPRGRATGDCGAHHVVDSWSGLRALIEGGA